MWDLRMCCYAMSRQVFLHAILRFHVVMSAQYCAQFIVVGAFEF